MLLRTVIGLLSLAVLLAAAWGGLFWVFLLTLLAAILGIRELYRLHPPHFDRLRIQDDGEERVSRRFRKPPLTGRRILPLVVSLSNLPMPSFDRLRMSGEDRMSGEERVSRRFGKPPLTGRRTLPLVVSLSNHPMPSFDRLRSGEERGGPGERMVLGGERADSDDASRGMASTPLPMLLGAAWVAAFIIGGAGASGVFQFWGISLGIFAVGAFVGVLWLIAFYRGAGWLSATAYLALGPVYVGFLLAHVMLLAQVGEAFFELDPLYFHPETGPTVYDVGRNWLIFALLVNSATDSGAYLVGRAVGRHPMAPAISPNKTWEGAVGGFACAVVAAFLLDRILDLGLGATAWDGAWLAVNWQPLVIGATVGVVSQFGDLLESRLKRISRVKDSGTVFPGHGGALDRLDSLLITLPTVYYLLVAVLRL